MEGKNPNPIEKKFINDPEACVPEALLGLALLNDNLRILSNTNIVVLKNISPSKVHLICGGGSGHEPAHAGFVCDELLSAAVCGGVFASPSYQDVLTAIKHCKSDKGVLVLIKNYTGDLINFNAAVQVAQSQGQKVMALKIGDDIALENVVPRGIAGTVLVYKILGAAAAKGKSLEEIHQLGTELLKKISTIGVAFDACALPGYPKMYKLEENQIEIGMGIHGEKGRERKVYKNCKEVVEELIGILNKFLKGKKVVVVLNNLGNCCNLEMQIIVGEVLTCLSERGIYVERVAMGRLMTSLDMHGFSISLLSLESLNEGEVLSYIDLPSVEFKAWKPIYLESGLVEEKRSKVEVDKNGVWMRNLLKNVGDGDIGIGVARASKKVLQELESYPFDQDVVKACAMIGEDIAKSFAGSSGALYGVFFVNASQKLTKKFVENTYENWLNALICGTNGIKNVGGAKPGDRTMIDSLEECVVEAGNILQKKKPESAIEILENLVKAAEKGAEQAKNCVGKKGRSSYLGERARGMKEPGCELIVMWMKFLWENIKI